MWERVLLGHRIERDAPTSVVCCIVCRPAAALPISHRTVHSKLQTKSVNLIAQPFHAMGEPGGINLKQALILIWNVERIGIYAT